MELSSSELNRAVTLLSMVCTGKSNLNTLRCIAVEGDQMIATDLEQELLVTVDCKNKSDVPFLVPLLTLKNFLRSKQKGQVTLTGDNATVTLICNGCKIEDFTYDYAGWPALMKTGEFPMYSVNLAAFQDAYRRVSVAASKDQTRYALNSVFYEDGKRLVSTDGKRLISVEVTDLKLPDVILPITKFLKSAKLSANGLVGISTVKDTKYLYLIAGPMVIYVARCIDARFPNYRQVIPERTHKEFTFLKDDVVRLKSICSMLASDHYHAIHVVTSDRGLCVFNHCGDGGPINPIYQGEIDLWVDRLLLLDMLEAGLLKLHLSQKGDYKAIRFEDEHSVGALMPLRDYN